MSDDAPRLLQATYHSTFRSMSTALATASTAGERLDAFQAQLDALDGTLNGFRHLTGAAVACRAGCAFCCCSLRIDARAHEVLNIARHLHATRSEADLTDLLAVLHATAEHSRASAPGPATPLPCALLDDGNCSLYDHRPSSCRRYFSRSAEACEELWLEGTTDQEIEYPFLAEAGRHAAAGTHNAFVRADYDGYSYDLTAALIEALSDPECESRWNRKERVFSQSAQSITPPGFSQDEAVARLRASLQPPGAGGEQ